MQVAAFAKPHDPDWRWRIVNYAGEVVEESRERFPTIAAAVASGTARLVQMNAVDHSVPAQPRNVWAHRRSRSSAGPA